MSVARGTTGFYFLRPARFLPPLLAVRALAALRTDCEPERRDAVLARVVLREPLVRALGSAVRFLAAAFFLVDLPVVFRLEEPDALCLAPFLAVPRLFGEAVPCALPLEPLPSAAGTAARSRRRSRPAPASRTSC